MCVEDFNNEIILGDTRTDSLNEIWNGEKYAQFRRDQFELKKGIKCTRQCDMTVIGEMVATVVNNRFDAGYHTVDFNAVNLPSGTYIYLIKATGENGVFTESKKMMLLK